MKYFQMHGGRCLDDLYTNKRWEQSARNVFYCKECLKVFPDVKSLNVTLDGKHPPFAVSGLGSVLAGLINKLLIEQIGSEYFQSQFVTGDAIINGEVSNTYKVYCSPTLYNLRGDQFSINEMCPCGRRKYFPMLEKGEPYMLRSNLPSEGVVQSNNNRLIVREDIFTRINWEGIPKPKFTPLRILDAPLDGDQSLF